MTWSCPFNPWFNKPKHNGCHFADEHFQMLVQYLLRFHKDFCSMCNRPVSQVPKCTCPISHSSPFCNRNVCTFLLQNGELWDICVMREGFLAATKQLYKWYFPSVRLSVRLSVRPSVCLSHLFDYVPIIVSS